MSNKRQLGFAIHPYLTGWNGYSPHNYEHVAFTNEGKPNRWYIDILSEYLGITTSFEISGPRSFPGFLVAKEAFQAGMWNCPACEAYYFTKNKFYRFGSHHYEVNGSYSMFKDEEAHVPWDPSYPRHDHINNFTVSAKTYVLNCYLSGGGCPAFNGWDNVVHVQGANYGFVDGHAETYDFTPILDLGLSTGGTRWRTGPFTDSELANTYSPRLTDNAAAAEC